MPYVYMALRGAGATRMADFGSGSCNFCRRLAEPHTRQCSIASPMYKDWSLKPAACVGSDDELFLSERMVQAMPVAGCTARMTPCERVRGAETGQKQAALALPGLG